MSFTPLTFSTELWCGGRQLEGGGGEDEDCSPPSKHRRVPAQEQPRLPPLPAPPAALKPVPDCRGGADRSRQESAGMARQVAQHREGGPGFGFGFGSGSGPGPGPGPCPGSGPGLGYALYLQGSFGWCQQLHLHQEQDRPPVSGAHLHRAEGV